MIKRMQYWQIISDTLDNLLNTSNQLFKLLDNLNSKWKKMPLVHSLISFKMNAIAWLEFELAYYDVTVQDISHYTMKSPFHSSVVDQAHGC